MKKHNIISRYGGITKEEPLSCIDNDILLKNTCVLEAVSPYFGYYNQAEHSVKPKMLYFVLDNYFSLEIITRATINVQKKVSFQFEIATGTISMFNQICYVIRLLNIHNYSNIALLQEYYLDEGLVFKKKSQTFQNEMAVIKLRRFFSLIELGNGLYFEENQPNFGYFEIDKNISWENFKTLTTEVKYHADLLYFDAARAFYFSNRNISDMVRIYRENLTKDKLLAIKDKYIKLMH